MKNTFINLLLLVLLPAFLRAQVSEEVVKKFPAQIISHIFDISSKVELTEAKQMQLGYYFRKQDSLAGIALAKGAPASVINRYYQPGPEELQNILSPLELNDYQLSLADDYSKYSAPVSKLKTTLRFRKQLGLNEGQIVELQKQSQAVKDSALKINFDAEKFENQAMDRILSKEQYKLFFFKINENKVKDIAAADLSELKKYGLFNVSDSLKLYTALYDYELNKTGTLNYFGSIGDSKGYDRNRDLIELSRPEILNRLDAYRNTSPWCRILNAVYNQKELQLNEKQIDTLLHQYVLLEKLDFDNKYNQMNPGLNWRSYENEHLLKILSTGQLGTYLQILNRSTAADNAGRDWENLKKYKLVNEADSVKINKGLMDYELRLLVSDEWIAIDNSKKNAFERQDILDKKPEVLRRLDITIKKEEESKIMRF